MWTEETDAMFWMVWSPTGEKSPTKRHFSEDEASREAERLARLHRGQEFFVMQGTSRVIADDLVRQRLIDKLPF